MADPRIPIGYSLLLLPNKQILRAKGLPPFPSHHTNRDHTLARWVSFPLKDSIKTVDDAIDYVSSEASGNDRCLKIRIGFGNGTQIIFACSNPRNPASIKISNDWDPQETFIATTAAQAAALRGAKRKELVPLVDYNGRGLCPKRPGTLSHFHPDKLFLTAPRPHASQVGFSFTPVSLPSFIVRPNYRIPGCRRGLGDFSETASHYRTKQFADAGSDFDNIEEITCRNAISRGRLDRAKDKVYNGIFIKTVKEEAGGPRPPHYPLQKQYGDTIGLSKRKQDDVIIRSIGAAGGDNSRTVVNGAGVIAPVVGRHPTAGGRRLKALTTKTNNNDNSCNGGNNNNINTDGCVNVKINGEFEDSFRSELRGDGGNGEGGSSEEYTSPQYQDY